MRKGLKILRAGMAVLVLTVISVFFLDASPSLPMELHLLIHAQIVPLLLGAGLLGLGLWLVVTLLFGRVYCSVVCPLGLLQDVIARIGTVFSKARSGKKRGMMQRQYQYSKPFVRLRYGVLLFFVVSLLGSFLLQFPLFVTLLDPYGTFGRMVSSLVRPFYLLGKNFLTPYFQSAGYYSVSFQPVIFNLGITLVSLLMFLLIGGLAFRYGRRYCNTICPVGTLLGIISRYSLFQFRFHRDCKGCGLCISQCKAECIDGKNKTIDMSRCVVCFNCLTACKTNHLRYTCFQADIVVKEKPKNLQPQTFPQKTSFHRSRRRLLLLAFLAPFFFRNGQLSNVLAEGVSTVPAELPQGKSKISYRQENAILPPGGISLQHFQARCTGCQLCTAKCPAHVILPANNEYGLGGFMQPTLRFRHGFCQFDCTICTEVCPSLALRKLSVAEKHQTQFGIAQFLQENCVVETQETNCGACAEHCPTGAVSMIPFGDTEKHLTIPTVKPELCIGCGACEYICPVRPYRAIYVEGNFVHQVASLPYDPEEKQKTVEVDFGF